MGDWITESEILSRVPNALGEDHYKEPLRILLQDLNHNLKPNLLFKKILRSIIVNFLKTRSRIYEYTKGKVLPEPAKPIIIIGLPRSGTTYLYNLLNQDSRFRGPLFYESFYPLIANDISFISDKVRLLKARIREFQYRLFMPKAYNLHAITARSPEECVWLTAIDFKSHLMSFMAELTKYPRYISECDFTSAYIWHKRFLQVLETQQRPDFWLLKNPWHSDRISDMLVAYPDAQFIHLHRDFSPTLSSMCNLVYESQRLISPTVDKKKLGKCILNTCLRGKKKYDEQRRKIAAERFIDVNFQDLVDRPNDVLKSIYKKMDIPSPDFCLHEIDKDVNEKKFKSKNNKQYPLHEFGLSDTDIDRLIHSDV